MTIASLGIVGSLAGTPMAQKGPEADKVQKETVDRSRQTGAEARAESAAGIGQTEEESQASERDADGRRLWERQLDEAPAAESTAPPPSEPTAPPAAKDPTGNCGTLLDIRG
jgi:hypothetical protein